MEVVKSECQPSEMPEVNGDCINEVQNVPLENDKASATGSQQDGDNAPGKKKNKRKEDKGIDQILKSLQIHATVEEKLHSLCKKYSELIEDHKTVQNICKTTQKTLTQANREKDQLQGDYTKAILAKSKLEGLCRELQKQNKMIKEESLNRAKEDDEKRKEVSLKFQTTINDIQQQMNDHYQKNSALREENQGLANKLKDLYDRYEIREQHMDKVLKTKELETQLYDAKLQQANLHLTEEKEIFLQEKQKLLLDAVDGQKRISILDEQNKQYKAQLDIYIQRFEEFQQTLTKSNEVFNSFKAEMDKMTKRIKKLEKENLTWRQKCEGSNKSLLAMAEEKINHERETNFLQTKISKLESLCRALQQERNKAIEPPKSSDEGTGVSTECKSESEKSEELDKEVEASSPSNDVPKAECACSEEH